MLTVARQRASRMHIKIARSKYMFYIFSAHIHSQGVPVLISFRCQSQGSRIRWRISRYFVKIKTIENLYKRSGWKNGDKMDRTKEEEILEKKKTEKWSRIFFEWFNFLFFFIENWEKDFLKMEFLKVRNFWNFIEVFDKISGLKNGLSNGLFFIESWEKVYIRKSQSSRFFGNWTQHKKSG